MLAALLTRRTLCLLAGCVVTLVVECAATEPPSLARRSDVLKKRFALSSPAANAYTISTDASFLITFVFNVVFLGAIAVAVASAAHQTAISSRRQADEAASLERRSSLARVRRRPAVFTTLAPDTVQAIVAHVSEAPPSAATSSTDHTPQYERYPSRYDEDASAEKSRFQPSSVDDILDYLYDTDRALYDELQARVAHRPLPPAPARGARDSDYAKYLAAVYGYSGQKADRDGNGERKTDRGGYSEQRAGWGEGYGDQQENGDGYGGQPADWQVDQQSAQVSYRASGDPGPGAMTSYVEKDDPLGAPPKFRRK